MRSFVAKALHIFLCVAAGHWISEGPSHRLYGLNRHPELVSSGKAREECRGKY